MRILIGLTALAFATTASAGKLIVEKRGIAPAFAWVDGQSHGKIKNRRPLELDLDEGTHEVWLALERDGTFTRCNGVVTIGKDVGATVSVRDMGCEGLQEGFGEAGRTHFRGSSVNFTLSGDLDAWVSVDGGQQMALPNMPFLLNLRPGQHTIVLFRDVMQETVFDQGTVTLAEGQMLPVTCTPAGCVGFDQPPQVITVLATQAPQAPASTPGIQIDVPGLSISVSGDAVNGNTTVNVDANTTAATTTGDANAGTSTTATSNHSCCVNDAYYDCPSVDAVNQCSGNFMACMMACGITDLECPDRCLEEHPLDPSACSRNPAQDATCRD